MAKPSSFAPLFLTVALSVSAAAGQECNGVSKDELGRALVDVGAFRQATAGVFVSPRGYRLDFDGLSKYCSSLRGGYSQLTVRGKDGRFYIIGIAEHEDSSGAMIAYQNWLDGTDYLQTVATDHYAEIVSETVVVDVFYYDPAQGPEKAPE